ncbi:MAG: hypothetical protein ACREBW_06590, partial [Candidatus Micrarchaeaceae archaeon]
MAERLRKDGMDRVEGAARRGIRPKQAGSLAVRGAEVSQPSENRGPFQPVNGVVEKIWRDGSGRIGYVHLWVTSVCGERATITPARPKH